MKAFHTRDDLMDFAARHAPTKACARVIRERGATILGGFNPVQNLPGWIIVVGADPPKDNRRWFIGVEVDEEKQAYRTVFLDAVPWENWAGRGEGDRPLIDGDRPLSSAYLRMKAREQHAISPP